MKILFNIIISLGVLFTACSSGITGTDIIYIKGSDTMLGLTSDLAEIYMKENPGVSIRIEGGGTAEGIKSLIKNEIDICTASRNLKPEEAKLLADYYGSLGMVFLIAKDGLSIYLNPGNNINNLSLQQLKQIYTGEIKNWKNIGGKDARIIPVTRNPNSGTYFFFKEHILDGEEYTDDKIVKSTTGEIINFVAENENAIGYGGMGYQGNVIHSKIEGVEPNSENIRNDTYPITRYLHFFTTKIPGGKVKSFIDWVLSPAGQSVIRKSGYIPLWENKL